MPLVFDTPSQEHASPAQTRGSALARNSAINLAGQFLPALLALAATPLLVRSLGIERFGLLSLAWVVLNYFSLFDLGLGRATVMKIAEALGRSAQHRIPSIFWTALSLQLGLACLGTAIVLLGGSALVSRLNGSPAVLAEAHGVLHVLQWSIAIVLLFNVSRGPLEAAQRFDLVNAVRVPVNSANVLIPLVGALMGLSLPAIVAGMIGARALGTVIHIVNCFRVLPGLRLNVHITSADAKDLLTFGGWITVSSVVGPLLVYADRFFVSLFLSVSATGFYSVPAELSTRFLMVPAGIVSTLFPELSALSARGDRQAMTSIARSAVKFLLFICAPVVLLLVLYSREILTGWVGAEFGQVANAPLRVLAVAVLINALSYVPYSLIQASGRPDFTAKLHVIELPLQLLLTMLLVQLWGVVGAALAWSLRVAIDAVVLFFAAPRIAASVRGVFPWSAAARFGGLMIAVGTCLAFLKVIGIPTWCAALAAACLVSGAALFVWRNMMSERERTAAISILRLRRVAPR
jgi:O-antigen/teichoic acid export membrane protein